MFSFLCSLFFSLRLFSKPLQYSTSPQILLQPWQECVFVTLKRALTLFSTSSFSSGDFSVMTCVGKTQAIHKAFYKSVLKMASPSYLPAPAPLPHFHLLQLIHPTMLLKKGLFIVFPDASWLFSWTRGHHSVSFTWSVTSFVLFVFLLAGQNKKKKMLWKLTMGISTFLNHGDLECQTLGVRINKVRLVSSFSLHSHMWLQVSSSQSLGKCCCLQEAFSGYLDVVVGIHNSLSFLLSVFNFVYFVPLLPGYDRILASVPT